ncbi:MAG TPA: hypothetical protein VG890_09810 [Puia sp.]|nr:hypothetical protein [Puia sp.]
MRNIISCLLLLAMLPVYARKGDTPKSDSGTVTITLENAFDKQSRIDSIYLIFDRYDKRGAGVIKQVFRSRDNVIQINVPSGRYYVNIFCLGIYNKAGFDRIVTVRANKERKISLRLQAPLFIPGSVKIPGQKWDPSHLAILKSDPSR